MTMPLGRTLCAAGAAVALAGCGGPEDPPDLPKSIAAGQRLSIAAREYVFAPNRVTVEGAPTAGVGQRIELFNRGELAHNIEVLDGDRIVGRLRSFEPNQQRAFSVRLPKGDYRFVCTVADHDEKGMRGTLKVR
jgi:plastocyanin